MAQRVKIVVEVEVDLDQVPGMFYIPRDWTGVMTRGILNQDHYHPELKSVKYFASDRGGVEHEVSERFCYFYEGKPVLADR
jgi:hypothetical protein